MPIRREDYYFGTSNEENDDSRDSSNEYEIENKAPKSLSSRSDLPTIKSYGSKYLRDRHNNVVKKIMINFDALYISPYCGLLQFNIIHNSP